MHVKFNCFLIAWKRRWVERWKFDSLNLLCEHLSPSHKEHTAYTVGYPCKPFIQPNQPWPDPSYTWAIHWYGCHVRVWSYTRSYKTIRDRVKSYETVYIWPYIKSTAQVGSTVSISHINRMKSYETVPKSYIQHQSAQTVNTIAIRPIQIIHGQVRVHTVSHGLVRSYTVFMCVKSCGVTIRPRIQRVHH